MDGASLAVSRCGAPGDALAACWPSFCASRFGGSCRRHAWPASIVVLAAAEIAGHAQRLRVGVDDDHRVDAIFVTCRQ